MLIALRLKHQNLEQEIREHRGRMSTIQNDIRWLRAQQAQSRRYVSVRCDSHPRKSEDSDCTAGEPAPAPIRRSYASTGASTRWTMVIKPAVGPWSTRPRSIRPSRERGQRGQLSSFYDDKGSWKRRPWKLSEPLHSEEKFVACPHGTVRIVVEITFLTKPCVYF